MMASGPLALKYVGDRILGPQLGEAERVGRALEFLDRLRGGSARGGVHRVRSFPERASGLRTQPGSPLFLVRDASTARSRTDERLKRLVEGIAGLGVA
jgi:hypothetical protein